MLTFGEINLANPLGPQLFKLHVAVLNLANERGRRLGKTLVVDEVERWQLRRGLERHSIKSSSSLVGMG